MIRVYGKSTGRLRYLLFLAQENNWSALAATPCLGRDREAAAKTASPFASFVVKYVGRAVVVLQRDSVAV